MDLLNEALLVTFPDSLSIAGVSYPCISPPKERFATMQQGPFDAGYTANFQMRAEDFDASKLQVRQSFKCGEYSFELKNVKRDPNDSLVQLYATLRQ